MLRAGIEELKIFGEMKQVRADIKVMDSFSAHGDRAEMFHFIENQLDAKKVFLVHGEYDTQQAFKGYLSEKGFKSIEIPQAGQSFDIE